MADNAARLVVAYVTAYAGMVLMIEYHRKMRRRFGFEDYIVLGRSHTGFEPR